MPNKAKIYTCAKCNFSTHKKYNYQCHLMTKRHKKMDDEEYENIAYFCKYCNYSTHKQSNYDKHLNTDKHRANSQFEENTTANETQGLKITEEMFCELVKSNQQLATIVQNGTNHITNNINNNTNNFNLNFFLNETCKDAINLKDFIESIEVSIMDLKKLGNKGYVEGISSLMIDKLNELDVTKRPIHSTDVKRNSIYIKDDDVWDKDEKEKLMSTLWDVARLETRALENKYKAEYPKCETDRDSREHEEYWRIFYNAMGGKGGDIEDLQRKVVKKIVQNVTIDKTKVY
jgi:hypothetical protein